VAPPGAALAALAATAALVGPALAHVAPGAAEHEPGQGGADRWLTLDPWALVPLAVLVVGFAAGTLRRRRGARVPALRLASFAAAAVALALALVWPLDALGERWFWAHMAQHMLLLAIAPPLLAIARPGAMMLNAVPRRLRPATAAPLRWRALRPLRALGRSAAVAGVLQAAVIWGWHLPAAFDLALRDDTVHRLEHLSFLLAGLLFWRTVAAAREREALRAVLWLFLTLLHSGMLGALLTFAPRPLYASYAAGGADALADQQLAGMLMWVPMAAVYVLAAMVIVHRRLVRPLAAAP
jgi:putative membrane protein